MRTKIGNGWFLLGDCFEHMATLPDMCAQMVLCDLPYGTTACKWDAILPFGELWAAYDRLCMGAVVLTAAQPFTTALAASNLPNLRHSLVWNKRFAGNFVQAKRMPLRTHEDVLVFCQTGKSPPYYPQMLKRDRPIKKGGNKRSEAIPIRQAVPGTFETEKKIYEEKYPTSILEFSNRTPGDRGFHPTQKPVALFEYLIRTYTQPGETVLDNTAGSGTTAIAAERAGRRWICIEKDPEYYARAVERVRAELET